MYVMVLYARVHVREHRLLSFHAIIVWAWHVQYGQATPGLLNACVACR